MNKALIKKYKAEFEHWLNGGNLLVRFATAKNPYKWYNIEEDFDAKSWNGHYGAQYIIDDKYVEFRKALVEGKTIQIYDIIKQHPDNPEFDVYDWKDFKSFKPYSRFTYEPNKYRIKPEEPKFNIGDWVVNKTSKQRIIKKVTSVYSDSVTVGDSTVGINVMLIKDLELWQPKLNDWCWFYDVPHYDMPVLQKFVTTIGNYYIALNGFNSKHTSLESVPSFEKGISDSYNRWKYCEPFLGTLPSTLKN